MRDAGPAPRLGAALKVATFNVNGVNGRLARLREWLDETSPDVVCLQEIKTTDEKCPARVLEDAGYGSLWHGQRSHHGVAILAKGERPVEIRRGLPGDELDRHARALLDSGRLAVLAGDLNVVPTKADIYNEWLWRFDAVVQPQTRAAFRRLLEQGWIDATRHLHPEERIYTFWVNDAAFRRNAGFRMDFLLLTPNLAPRLVAAGVDTAHRGRDKPSDHAPVWVEL